MKRLNSGITLIALVMTIIIMLILVSVTISLTVKGNLFGYASNSTKETNASKAYEQLDVVKMAWQIEETTNLNASISNFLASEKSKGNIDDYVDLGEGIYTITKDGYEREIQGPYYFDFYIYHSSDNTVETIHHKKGNTYNISAKAKDRHYYAGYYSDYEGKGSYADDGVEVKDGTEIAYNGMNATWNADDAITEKGTMMNPIEGKTYYLKEIPQNLYLRQVARYSLRGDRIICFFPFAALDDTNYKEAGYMVNSQEDKRSSELSDVVTITLADNGRTKQFTPVEFYGQRGLTSGGYLLYTIIQGEENNGTSPSNEIGEDKFLELWPYMITLDDVLVVSRHYRKYSFGNMTASQCTISEQTSVD